MKNVQEGRLDVRDARPKRVAVHPHITCFASISSRPRGSSRQECTKVADNRNCKHGKNTVQYLSKQVHYVGTNMKKTDACVDADQDSETDIHTEWGYLRPK